ncbi:Uncharacterized protein HZ326_24278 [Fusarium oxysporum f. sp. albedinis]|nr:Uncharacterized protein HZ326_24278 [Fusarium oxysporum f. sp. albedinis]
MVYRNCPAAYTEKWVERALYWFALEQRQDLHGQSNPCLDLEYLREMFSWRKAAIKSPALVAPICAKTRLHLYFLGNL